MRTRANDLTDHEAVDLDPGDRVVVAVIRDGEAMIDWEIEIEADSILIVAEV